MSGPHFRASERPPTLVVRAPLGRGVGEGLLLLGLAAACWGIALPVVGWWAALPAVYLAPVGAARVLRALLRLPLLRVDDEGIRTSWAWDAAGTVPWQEVRRIRVRPPYLAVEVVSGQVVVDRAAPPRRRALRRRQRAAGTPVTVRTRVLEPRVAETVTLVHHWRNHVTWLRDRQGRERFPR